MKNLILLFLLILLFSSTSFLAAQNVSINNSGATPDASAMLDVSSTTKGMLLPRMTTAERDAINNPVQGLLVYDTDLKSLLFYDGSTWTSIRTTLQDADGDTKIQVEETVDEDIIRFDLEGAEKVVFRTNSAGQPRIEMINRDDLFIGTNAGANNTTGFFNTFIGGRNVGGNNTTGSVNTFIGAQAGQDNTTGVGNTFIGGQAGQKNTGGFKNTFIGVAGISNTTGNFNTFIGFAAGQSNTTGFSNTFTGPQAGASNTTGNANTFIGRQAGENNTTGFRNTFIGQSAGFFNEAGSNNVFLGFRAGHSETGGNKLYIDNSDTSTPLIYGDFATEELTFYGNVGIGTASPKQQLHNTGDYYGKGHFWLHAFEGDGNSGVAYLQARDDSGSSSIGLQLRTQNSGNFVDALSILPNGTTTVNGDFFVNNGSKNFITDHPLDPANKSLRHSCVESPEVLNVYSGTVILNTAGKAQVELPDYFEAMNKDFRYQLTCLGGYAPVYISKKVSNNRFEIAGGSSGLEVSWEVTGVRNDPWFRDHPYQAVEEKTGREKGRYYYPEGYGMPAERSIGRMEEDSESEN